MPWFNLPINNQNIRAPFFIFFLFFLFGFSGGAKAQYAGTYSVGGTSPDFKTLDSAFFYLSKKGITSSVRLQVRSGSYNGQMVFDSIKGSSSSNKIKIVPDPKNTGPVRFKHKITSLANNYIFRVRQGYWQFDSIQFVVDSSSLYGRIFDFTANCQDVAFNHCTFFGRDTLNQCNLYFSIIQDLSNVNVNQFKIQNCQFFNGSAALVHLGTNSAYETGLEVLNSNFLGYNCYALSLAYNTSPLIQGNRFVDDKRSGSYKTMQIYYCDSFALIENKVQMLVGRSSYGIHILDCNGSSLKPNIIANNTMAVYDSTSANTSPSIYLEGGKYNSLYYNTFVTYAHAKNSKCLYLDQKTSGQNSRLVNNNFVNLGGGYAFYVLGFAGFSEMDYNNYYSNGNVLAYLNGSDLGTLKDVQQATKMESKSLNARVEYSNIYDLNSKTYELDSAAKPLSGFSRDIDGNIRDSKKPDIGAYEFNVPADNLGIAAILSPASQVCGYDSVAIQVVLKNYGRKDAKNFKVSMVVRDINNSVLIDTLSASKTIKSQALDTFTFKRFWTKQGGFFKVSCKIEYSVDSLTSNDTLSRNLYLTSAVTSPDAAWDTVCSNESVNLTTKYSASHYLKWYTARFGGKLIATANQITVSNLKSDTSFYMASVQLTPTSDKISTPKVPQTSCNAGIMFDIVPKKTIKIDSFASSFISSGKQLIYVYMRRTSYSGNETNPKGWISMDTITVNVSSTTGYANIPLKRSIKLNKDTAYGFYLYFTSVKYAYTTNTVYSNSDLAIKTGSALCGFFSSALSDRAFVGDVFYTKYVECESPRVPFNVKVKPAPKLNLGSDTAFCSNNGFYLRLDGGTDADQYQWSTKDTTRFVNINKEGKYSVIVKNSMGCYNADSIFIKKNISPKVNIGKDTGFCPENGINLSLDAGSGFSSYQWQPSGNAQTFQVIGEGKYKVTVNDKNKCSGSDSILVKPFLSNKPQLGKDTTYCMPGTIPFILNAGKGFKTYTWSNKAATPSISVTKSGNYWVNVIDTNGCKNGDSLFVLISDIPKVDLGSDTNYCLEKAAFVLLDAGAGYSRYLWSNLETGNQIKVNKSGLYHVSVFNSVNCVGRDSLFIKVNQNPKVNLGNDTAYCSKDGIKLNLDAGTGYRKYLWWDGTTKQKNLIIKEGQFFVTVTDSNNCNGSDTLKVRMKQSPVIDLGPDIKLPGGSSISKTLDAGAGFVRYLWNTKATSQKITVNQEGTYFVEVLDTNGCYGMDTIQISLQSSGISNRMMENRIMMSPNPCHEILQLRVNQGEIGMLMVYNPQGQLLLQNQISKRSITLNTGEFANGLYSLVIWIDQLPYSAKFMVMHP